MQHNPSLENGMESVAISEKASENGSSSIDDCKEANSSNQHQEQKITPWDVQGEVKNGQAQAIDYKKLMDQFGCKPIEPSLIQRLEEQTGIPVHPLLRRGAFYCHRDLERILDLHKEGKPFYLYTGRGPSSESMHVGHMVPFLMCKYLQDAFRCPLVIQMTDDEKFLFKEPLSLQQCKQYAFENAKDIIAVGFDAALTFIFCNTQYMGRMYETCLRIQKCVNLNQASNIFGFQPQDNIGKIAFPATQMAPCFSEAFPHIFPPVKANADANLETGKKNKVGGDRPRQLRGGIPCLIPYAIDQDPYFRLCRDIAPRLGAPKPASICSIFFPALQGSQSKMSSSAESSAIFMTDTPKTITKKLKKYAFSGGRARIEEQRELGADLSVDVAYQYLRFFLHDDQELADIEAKYGDGRMLTGEVKARCAEVLVDFVHAFQQRRELVDDATVAIFMDQGTRATYK